MEQLIVSISILLLMLTMQGRVFASGKVLIVQLQTGSVSNANDEFVRIANCGETVDVTGWKLQYKSASGQSWTTKATLQGELAADAVLLISTSDHATTDSHQLMLNGLAQSGGHIQLLSNTGVVQDLLGWGSAAHADTAPAPTQTSGQTLDRKSIVGVYVDTDNNADDFQLSVLPVSSDTTPPPEPLPDPVPASDETMLLSPPQITELFPNPAAPQTDEKDEFIELYNPNDMPFSLHGYKLQTGLTFSYSLTFTDQIMPANGYMTLTSSATSLTLSNSAGAARLLDPTGNTVALSTNYGTAIEGASWALIDGVWQWTASPTPGAANTLAAPVAAKPATTKSANTTTSKTQTATTNSPKSSKTSKTAKTTAANSKPATAAKSSPGVTDASQPRSALHPLILAGVGTLAVGYGVYEYRQDIGNAIFKLRRYRAHRRSSRQTVEGRGGD